MRNPLVKISKAVLMTAAALITCAPPAKAVTYYWWDANGSTAGQGGTGAWNTTSTNWVNGGATFVTPSANAVPGANTFANTEVAVFSGTQGVSSLSGTGTTTLNGIISLVGQTISASSGSPTLTISGTTPKITVASGSTLRIGVGLAAGSTFTLGNEGAIGGGVLELTAANAMTGVLNVLSGSVRLAHADALKMAKVNLGAGSGGLVFSDVTPTYKIGRLEGVRNLDIGASNIEVGAGAGDGTFSGVISGTGLISKIGSAAWTLNATANTFTGTLTVGTSGVATSGGTLNLFGANTGVAGIAVHGTGSILVAGAPGALGDSARSTTVNVGAQLRLDTQSASPQDYNANGTRGYDFESAEPLTIGGVAVAGVAVESSALYNHVGVSRLTGPVTLLGSASSASPLLTRIGANTASKLFIDGPVSVEAGKYADLTLRVYNRPSTGGQISLGGVLNLGTGKLALEGTDNLHSSFVGLLSNNAYSGGTTIGTSSYSVYGVVAGAPRAFGTGDVELTFGNIVAAADLDMSTATFKLVRGDVWRAADKLKLGGIFTRDFDSLASQAGSITANAYDLRYGNINVPLHGGAGNVTKTTGSVVSLRAANTYTGITNIQSGYLRAYDASSLGLSGSVGAHTLISGGTLDLYSSMPNFAEDFVLSGTGYLSNGAIRNSSGTTKLTGGVTLASASRINNATIGGILTLGAGSAISGSYDLTIGGAGPVVIDRDIQTGSGRLYKDGDSQLTLNGNGYYDGITSITTANTKGKGRFIVHGSLNGTGAVSVGANAVLGGTGYVGGPVTLINHTTGTRTTLEVGEKERTGGRASFSLGSSLSIPVLADIRVMSPLAFADTDAGAPLEVAGDLLLGGANASVRVSLNNAVLASGSYHLIKHGRTSGGVATTLGAADMARLNLQAGAYRLSTVRDPINSRAVLVDRPGYVDLVVTGGIIYWKGIADAGGVPSQWDTARTNWTLKSYNGTTTTEGLVKFITNDHVVFDDSPDVSAPTAITLTALRDTFIAEFRNSTRDYSFSGNVISADTARKSGSGLVTFNNTNTFSTFAFEDGTIRAGANNVLGAVQVNVGGRSDDLSTVADEGRRPRLSSTDTTARSFSSRFEIRSDEFILGDANASRNGRLNISGIVNLGVNDRALTVESEVLLSSRLIADQDSDNFALSATADGILRKRGVGRLILSADNAFGSSFVDVIDADTSQTAYAGQIIVESGVLQVGNASTTGSVLSDIANYGTVEFNRTNLSSYDAVLSGSGTLDKRGSGVLDLTGNNTLSGLATVYNGGLKINGKYAGGMDIRAGAFLGGSGRIDGNVVIAGEHRPGNSPGVQTIAGNLAYSTGAALQWELTANTSSQADPAVFDQILVGGNLSFAGTTTATLIFNGTGSLVNWSDPFWASDQQWIVYNVAGAISGEVNLTRAIANWSDGQGDLFNTVLPGASFSFLKIGQGVVLSYDSGTAVRPGAGAGTNVNAGATYVNNPFPGGVTTVTNTGTPGAENLNATVTPGAGVTGGGAAAGLVAGDAAGQTIGLNLSPPTAPGVITRTATINFVSVPSSTSLTPVTIDVNGVVYERAAATLPAAISFGSIRRGPSINQTFATTTLSVTNSATSLQHLGAPLGDSLSVSWINPTTDVLTFGSITSLAPQATSGALQVTLDSGAPAGRINQVVVLRSISEPPAAAAAAGYGQVITDAPVAVDGRIYNHAIGLLDSSDLTINLGRVRVGTPFRSESLEITNSVAMDPYSETLGAMLGTLGAGISPVGGLSRLLPGQTSGALGITITSNTAGYHSGSATITFITEGLDGSNLNNAVVGTQVINVSGVVDALAQVQISSQLNGGRVHAGGMFPVTDVSVANGAPSGPYSDDLRVVVDHADTNLWHNGQSVLALGGASADTGTIKVQLLDASTPGEKAGDLILRSSSISHGALADEDLGVTTVTVSGLAYSGHGTWQGGNNDWTTGAVENHWSRWERLGGIPGKDAVLSIGDTATFVGATANAIRLNGLSPELAALNFNNSSGISITRAASEGLTLGIGVASADINVTAGQNTLFVPIVLRQNLSVNVAAGSSIDLRGDVASPGATRITMTGSGEVIVGSSISPGLDLNVAGSSVRISVNNTFADGVLESGRIASDGTSKTLAFDSLVKSGQAGSVGVLGDVFSPSALTIQSLTTVQVASGILRNNARVLAPINVGSGTTLGGRGSSQSVMMAANSTLAPGNSIDSYTVNGDLTFNPTSTFQVEVNGIVADRVDVTGTANLSGLVEVRYLSPGPGLAAGQTYTILTYGSMGGTFNATDVSFDAATAAMYPSLDPELNILANRTELTFRLTENVGNPSPSVGALLGFFGRNSNLFVQSVIGDPYMKAGMRGPSMASGLTGDSLLGARNQLDQLVTGATSDGSWLKGYADNAEVNQGGVWDFDHTVGGISGGIDLIRTGDWAMGIAFGTAKSEARHQFAGDRSSATSYDIGFYSCANGDGSQVSFVAFFSQFDVEHTRYTQVGTIRQATVGNPDSFRTGVSLSWDGNVHSTDLTRTFLRARLGGGLNHRDAFRETGDASVAMNFDAADTPYFELDLGLGASHDLSREGDIWRLYGEGMFCRRVAGGDLITQSRFNQSVSGAPVNVLSADQTYLAFRPSVGLSWQSGVSFADLRISAEIRAGEVSPSATFNAGIRF